MQEVYHTTVAKEKVNESFQLSASETQWESSYKNQDKTRVKYLRVRSTAADRVEGGWNSEQ